MLTRLPRAVGPLGNALVSALYDERLRAATQVPDPAWPIRAGLHAGLKARAAILRHLARPRAVGMFEDGIHTKSYPDGYEISRCAQRDPEDGRRDAGAVVVAAGHQDRAVRQRRRRRVLPFHRAPAAVRNRPPAYTSTPKPPATATRPSGRATTASEIL